MKNQRRRGAPEFLLSPRLPGDRSSGSEIDGGCANSPRRITRMAAAGTSRKEESAKEGSARVSAVPRWRGDRSSGSEIDGGCENSPAGSADGRRRHVTNLQESSEISSERPGGIWVFCHTHGSYLLGMDGWAETRTVDQQIDSWREEVLAVEAEITRLRARQVVLIRQLDRYQVDTGDGARTMGDWTSAHLDLSHQTSSRLTQLAHASDPEIDQAMREGRWGLDRAAALVKLRSTGLNGPEFTEAAEKYSLGRLYGLLDRLRRLTPTDETDVFEYRYLVIQPSLDESVFKLWGTLTGIDGRIIEKALTAREGEFPVLPHQGQGQRRADALTSICMDSLTGGSEGETDRAVTVAEVFIDAGLAAESHGEAGATVSSGPRVGPNTLTEILCTGKIRAIVTDGIHPVAYTDLGEAIPPAIRQYVQWRDQNRCSIEGCHSTYRLQPHHIRERRHGGNHHPDNLLTLCWYHHHVAIHGCGYRIDPQSPTHRRQLLKPHSHGPPHRSASCP
jgi:hypothetical protein